MRLLFVAVLLVSGLAGCLSEGAADDVPSPTVAPSSSPTTQPGQDESPDQAEPSKNNTTPPDNSTGPPEDNSTTPEENATGPEPKPEPGPKPVWGDPESAPIYPGVYISTGNSSCTTNFLFTSPDYRHIYIASAAHCFGAADVDPCDASKSVPPAPGAPVEFIEEFGPNDVQPVTIVGDIYTQNTTGTLVYNSWYTQRVLLDDPEGPECTDINDFALIEIPLEAQDLMTPVWRHFGIAATHVLEPGEIQRGDQVIGYGHSALWLGLDPLYPKQGVITGAPDETAGYWGFTPALAPHGIFGDSGSPVMTTDGGAAGVVSKLGTNPLYPSVGVGNTAITLHTALEYMESHTELRVQLAQP